MELIVLVVIVALAIPLLRGFMAGLRQKESQQTQHGKGKRPPLSTEWPPIGYFNFQVVGESNYQSALALLAGNHGNTSPETIHIASLIPDDHNPHDAKAVRVEISGRVVGFMSREDARRFRRRLGQSGLTGKITTCNAMITGGFLMKNGDRAHYGVTLDLKPFAD